MLPGRSKKVKLKIANCIGFSQARKFTMKLHLSESLTFQNLLKNRKLLPAEKFGNILAFDKESTKLLSLNQLTVFLKIIYIMTLGLKFLLCLNGKLFDFKKTSFIYCGFSVVISVFL